MLINLRNALMTRKRLPYDAKVEYIESTGTQYLETGVYATENTRVNATLMTISTGNRNWFGGSIAGSAERSNGFVFNSYSSSRVEYLFGGGRGWSTVPVTNAVGRVFTLDFSKGGVVIDGTTVATPSYTSFAQNTGQICICVRYRNSGYISGRIYAFRIYEGATLVRDFIPVRVGQVGYLYDRVSGALFGNAGTGDFVLGPDVVSVEYIESTGTQYIDTGVTATGATNSEFQFKMSVTGFAFGARTAWNEVGYSLNYATGNYAFNYGNTSSVAALRSTIPVDTNWHTAKILSGGVLSLDAWTNTVGSYSFTTSDNLILFGTRQGSLLNRTASGFKYCKIWESSTPVLDYVPVRVGSGSTWEGAMMDVLTRRIYRNQGTGAFGYGGDLPLETLAN